MKKKNSKRNLYDRLTMHLDLNEQFNDLKNNLSYTKIHHLRTKHMQRKIIQNV